MTENARTWFKDGSYPADLGVRVEAADDAQSRLSLPYDERNTMFGLVHGGAVASLASIAALAIARESPRAVVGPEADAGAIRAAMAASPFLSRRGLRLVGVRRGAVEMALDAAAANLDGDGAIHEGAVLTLIDAAGATCPWTAVSPSPGASGATIALNAHVLGPLPGGGLVARAVVRARDARICWTSVTVVDSASRKVHALGTVVYRFADKNGP
ncbi:hypothetical protein WME94_49210 [Sorangium sp. So ce429]